jgi:7-cyano-7-deazaguanine synthase
MVSRILSAAKLAGANRILETMSKLSFARGRDGRGYTVLDGHVFGRREVERAETWGRKVFFEDAGQPHQTMIANFRAEPTTEYVAHKNLFDQQPYHAGPWTIVHNGTIANDKELRTGELTTSIDSAAIVEVLNSFPTDGMPFETLCDYFATCMEKLKGSYAILAMHKSFPGHLWTAANYRPIWKGEDRITNAVYFASSSDYFPPFITPVMLQPYAMYAFTPHGQICLRTHNDYAKEPVARVGRALVVCSGGLDSVVAATSMVRQGYDVQLCHFTYGSRAQEPEERAIVAVASYLDVELNRLPMNIYDKEDSPLLRKDSTIAGGEEGAEFAHEWVPARNLVMLALATAFAEAKGFDYIVLGNNLEEAGAYPDNEPEFINRFNELLPFAVGDGKRVRVLMPVGNMMKHEIVALGHEIGAPLHLTWSCYRDGELHCGTCGPCHMRRTAFRINSLEEVIKYEGN